LKLFYFETQQRILSGEWKISEDLAIRLAAYDCIIRKLPKREIIPDHVRKRKKERKREEK